MSSSFNRLSLPLAVRGNSGFWRRRSRSFYKFLLNLKISETPIPLVVWRRAWDWQPTLRSLWEAVGTSRAAHAWALSPARVRAPPPPRARPIKSQGTRSLPQVSVRSYSRLGQVLCLWEHRLREPWPKSCTTRSSPGRASRRVCRSGGSRSWSWCPCPRALTATSTSGMPTWCCTPPRRAEVSPTACTSGLVRGPRSRTPACSGQGGADAGVCGLQARRKRGPQIGNAWRLVVLAAPSRDLPFLTGHPLLAEINSWPTANRGADEVRSRFTPLAFSFVKPVPGF